MTVDNAVEVNGLTVATSDGRVIIEDISLRVARGECVGIVGESGSGKSTFALALLGYTRPGLSLVAGGIKISGQEIVGRPDRDLRHLRGNLISYVPQDPASALNPSLRVEEQVAEVLRAHRPLDDRHSAIAAALTAVELPAHRAMRRRYPHQLSGGQQQRLALAMALVCRPPVVVLDEPTTGLDVITQSKILEEIGRLRAESGITVLYISHDLAVVSSIADRIVVMYAGRIVEQGRASRVLRSPRHPYTHGLISSVPDPAYPRELRGIPGVAVGVGDRPLGCAFAPRCPMRVDSCTKALPDLVEVDVGWWVRCLRWSDTPALAVTPRQAGGPETDPRRVLEVRDLRAVHWSRHQEVVAADQVSFSVGRGECVALVGESGSGKTTIARCIAGLHQPSAGKVLLHGVPIPALARHRPLSARRRLQIVFQNPYQSLNPQYRIGQIIARPARVLAGLDGKRAAANVSDLLERVRLPRRTADRYPAELSGGERQRVAIARALAAEPDVVVCDEITSALDVSVQAAVLNLIAELRVDLGLSLLLITHDLGIVASIADRVLVLDKGRICEEGSVTAVLRAPSQPYTRALIEAAPSIASVGSPA